MKIQIIKCLQDNYSYLIIDENNRSACIVDPSESGPIIDFIDNNKINLKYILNTHHHHDHIGGNLELKKKYNLKPLIISEAHVMAEFFDKFGMKKINELNGMFAFIFYNLKSRKVIFFRDRYGIKPLNYTFINNNIYVSSEIKPLLDIRNKLGIKNYQIEQDSVINFLFRARINHDQYTFFKNIHSLTPGHYLSFDLRDNKYFIKRFYFFKKRKFFRNFRHLFLIN